MSDGLVTSGLRLHIPTGVCSPTIIDIISFSSLASLASLSHSSVLVDNDALLLSREIPDDTVTALVRTELFGASAIRTGAFYRSEIFSCGSCSIAGRVRRRFSRRRPLGSSWRRRAR